MSDIDPVELQVLAGAAQALCEEMGAVLIRAAHSPNIKERRDASTALFDASGEMVMQAEHIPVHLGAMPMAMETVLRRFELRPGDVVIMNDPFTGGTHLPDVSLVSAAFDPSGRRLGSRSPAPHDGRSFRRRSRRAPT